jgi:hypothetical protein
MLIATFKPIHFSAGAINPIATEEYFQVWTTYVRELSYEYGQMFVRIKANKAYLKYRG